MERGKSLPIDAVWVNREKRQRKELTGIEELASSIARTGHLIHPITVMRSGELVAGERRLTAVRSLGWTSIDVQFLEDMPPDEVRLIELEENVARIDLSWQDQCNAIAEYHELRTKTDPEWNKARTAEALNVSLPMLVTKLDVAAEIKKGNQMVVEAPKYSVARGIVSRASERAKTANLINLDAKINPEKSAEIIAKANEVPLVNTDFSTWLNNYSGDPSINFVHCDFPYGVNMHKSDQGAGSSFGTYEDTPDIYWELLNELRRAMDVCIASSAHLMFWFSMDFYHDTKRLLTEMGWKVNPFPLIWHKSDNIGIIPDAQRGPRRIYETAFMASRGDRLIVRPTSNVSSAPSGDKSVHMNQKSEIMLGYFFQMFVDNTTVMLDPTCGSGSAVKAAKAKGAHSVLGLERDPEFYARAVDHFRV